MKPTEKQICQMQLDIPDMKPSDISYNETSGKCEIKSGGNWYKVRCKQIGGYWYKDKCYVK